MFTLYISIEVEKYMLYVLNKSAETLHIKHRHIKNIASKNDYRNIAKLMFAPPTINNNRCVLMGGWWGGGQYHARFTV